jgi:hypothetical protein
MWKNYYYYFTYAINTFKQFNIYLFFAKINIKNLKIVSLIKFKGSKVKFSNLKLEPIFSILISIFNF